MYESVVGAYTGLDNQPHLAVPVYLIGIGAALPAIKKCCYAVTIKTLLSVKLSARWMAGSFWLNLCELLLQYYGNKHPFLKKKS